MRISFRGSGLDVDVSPVIVIYEGDKEYKGYLINKDTGERVLTSIPQHLEFIRKRKKKVPQHFRQVIRLIKWWNKERKKEDGDFKFNSKKHVDNVSERITNVKPTVSIGKLLQVFYNSFLRILR